MAQLEFKHITKVYDQKVKAVDDFNLVVNDNDFIVLVGPSGCGKSTLLRMVAGLEEITEGELLINDKVVNDLSPSQRNIAMVFQNYALFGNMTVYENIAFSQIINRVSSDKIHETVKRVAKIVDLEEYLKRYPRQLSGGQRQRVAVGRALVKNSDLLLMDEPLSNLDAKLRNQTRKEIATLHKDLNLTIIYVTHDQIEAMSMASKIVVLNGGQTMQVGTPREVYNHPNNTFVARFIGTHPMNIVTATVKNNQLVLADHQVLDIDTTDYQKLVDLQKEQVLVGFRAEVALLNDATTEIEVTSTEYLGSQIIVNGLLAATPVILVFDGDSDVFKEKINIKIRPEDYHFFDLDTEERLI